jgi:hypothetical protein
MDWNDIQHRSHEDILLEREESGKKSKGNMKKERQQREAKQTGVTDLKTCNWQRSVGDMLMQREILRQRKQRQHQEAKQEARTDGLKRHSAQKSWTYTVEKTQFYELRFQIAFLYVVRFHHYTPV